MTAGRPIKKRIAPTASSETTISPQTAIINGLDMTALIEVLTAVAALTSLSKSIGKATTEIANATTAKLNPTTVPYTINAPPRRVVSTWFTKSGIETGGSAPNRPQEINCVTYSQAT